MIFSLGFISEATSVPRGALCQHLGVPGPLARWLHRVSESPALIMEVSHPHFSLIHGEGRSYDFDLTA